MKYNLSMPLLTVLAVGWVLFLALAYDSNRRPNDQIAEFCKKDSNWVMYARICP